MERVKAAALAAAVARDQAAERPAAVERVARDVQGLAVGGVLVVGFLLWESDWRAALAAAAVCALLLALGDALRRGSRAARDALVVVFVAVPAWIGREGGGSVGLVVGFALVAAVLGPDVARLYGRKCQTWFESGCTDV